MKKCFEVFEEVWPVVCYDMQIAFLIKKLEILFPGLAHAFQMKLSSISIL